LICGHTGCGRYKGSHAAKHYEETGHGFALELGEGNRAGSQRVWDYMRDTYVHRLVDGSTDDVSSDPVMAEEGEKRAAIEQKMGSTIDRAQMQSKVDTITTEMTQLMLSQMETQRVYYEGIVDSHHRETERALEAMNASVSCGHAAAAAADLAAQKAEQTARAAQRMNQDLKEKLHTSMREQSFLRELNETLLSDTKGWRERVRAVETERDGLKAEVEELRDQVKDLMMFIEARDAIEKGSFGGELAGGTVGVTGRATRGRGKRR